MRCMTTTTEPIPVLRADRLYELDGGRITCGRWQCAGQAAAFTGVTLAGQRAREIDAQDRRDFRAYNLVLKCVSCGQRD